MPIALGGPILRWSLATPRDAIPFMAGTIANVDVEGGEGWFMRGSTARFLAQIGGILLNTGRWRELATDDMFGRVGHHHDAGHAAQEGCTRPSKWSTGIGLLHCDWMDPVWAYGVSPLPKGSMADA